MKIANNQKVPDFSINDVYGNKVSISDFKGQKVHLNFYRFSGCPFCNLRFHEIDKLTAEYKKNNVKLISVFESSEENMKAQMAGESFYATMIPDAGSKLYTLFDLDRSMWGLLKFFLFKGGITKVLQGTKLFKQKVKLDGHTDRIEAEFLIDANGTVVNAFYGETPGDNLPVDTIKDFIRL
jgi:peroxiredoxin Q/BCP